MFAQAQINRPNTTDMNGSRRKKLHGNLTPEDFSRIKEYDSLPRACILKNLIRRRRSNNAQSLKREEFNYISQGAALYSANPINSVL